MLHVALLGEQAITDDATGVRTRSPRAVALVAFLVVNAGVAQSRQRIAGLFWPESSEAQALTNLRRELHHLRQALDGDASLVVTSRDLCWRDTGSCRVDVRLFEAERQAALATSEAGDGGAAAAHAAQAIAQYKGELLPGSYDDWLIEARAELQRRCVDMCDLLCAAGEPSRAVDAARLRIRLQPLEEAGYRVLMELQAELGDRAGAVGTYHRCASVLERELGVTPDPATQRVFRRLMARADPAPAPDGPGISGPVAARLVGRARELGVLTDLWRTAAGGRPGFALVRGGAGVGKTRLVTEIAELARREGAVVAGSQCFGSSGRLALAPVADWVRNPAVRAAVATLDETWRAEVGRLVPDARQDRRSAGTRAMVDAWQRHRFFEGLSRALHAVGRPTLLVLDNLQWCDAETLSFVAFCLRLAPRAQIMVAATLREDEHDLADWIVQMRATGLLTEVSLGPLEEAETKRLAEAIAGRALCEDDVHLLQGTTGGFPLYVVEAVRGGSDPGGRPPWEGDLTSVLRSRFESLSPPAREIAGLAAAVQTDFTLDLLTEASDLAPGAVVEAVDELWRRRIVREFGDGYDFSHDLLREAAYAQVSPPKRWLLHRRVAQGLELLHADDTDAVSSRLAEQYARGGRPDRAVTYYRRAAEVAAGVFAHAEAIRLHSEALSVVRAQPEGRGRDGRELAILETMAAPLNAHHGFSSPQLKDALERTVALAESLGRDDSLLTGLVALWTSRFVQGRTADAYRTAERALSLADPDSEQSSQAHFAAGGSDVSLGRPADALHHLDLAARLARGVSLSIGSRLDVHGAAWAAHAHWLLGHDTAALAACTDTIALAREIGHPYSLAVALAYGAVTHQMRRDMPTLREAVTELRELCGRYGFAYYRDWGLVLDGWSRRDTGLARQGIANLKDQGSFARMPYWLSLLADLLAAEDRPDAARSTLDAALAAGHARDDLWWIPEVMRMRAAHDAPEAAAARLRSAARMAASHGSTALLQRCEDSLAPLR